MIKFFRHIRKSLIQENQMGKYFTYAIGEIILVVIGILIALAINNWNEGRKESVQELTILHQLETEFKSNLKQLDQKISSKKETINSALQLFKYIDNANLRNKDSVNYHLVRTIPYTTFDPIINDLASSGELRLISNDSLKQKLTFWTSAIADVREDEIQWKDYRDNKYVPFLVKHYQLRTLRNLANKSNVLGKYLIEDTKENEELNIGLTKHPEDFDALLNHPDYEDHLERCLTKSRHSINQSMILRKRIIEILDVLKFELK